MNLYTQYHKAPKSNTLLVMCHGMTDSCDAVDAFSFPEYQTLRPDLNIFRFDARGHGLSEGSINPQDYTWESMARDFCQVFSEIFNQVKPDERRNVILLGDSMGTGMLLHFLLNHCNFEGERAKYKESAIHGLVFYRPPTCWETRTSTWKACQNLSEKLKDFGLIEYVNFLKRAPSSEFSQKLPHALQKRLKNCTFEHLLKMKQEHLYAMLSGSTLSDFPPRGSVGKIPVPTLVFGVQGDPMHPASSVEVLQAVMPRVHSQIAKSHRDVMDFPLRIRKFVSMVSDSGKIEK